MKTFIALLSLLFALPASADSYLKIDPIATLSNIVRKDKNGEPNIMVNTSIMGNHYQVDASAVLDISPERFLEATVDFEHYVDMKMDYVDAAHCIGDCRANQSIFWMKVSALGISSQNYSQLQVFRSLEEHALGATWQQIRGNWGYPDSPKTAGMEGSVYVLPLGDSRPDGVRGTYIRYVMGATVNTLPSWLIGGFVKGEMKSNLKHAILKLAARAR